MAHLERPPSRRSVVNITVHGIGPAGRKLDPAKEEFWVSVAHFEQVLDAMADRSDVRISFDDGNASDVEVALHIGGDSESKPRELES